MGADADVTKSPAILVTPFERHLQAAQGFLDLGLPLEAHEEELEEIEPELRHLSEVLALQVPIFQALRKWALMEVVAKELCIRQPDEPRWLLSLADAIRRGRSLQEGMQVLVQAAMRFPEEAILFYRLACYQAQLGYLDAARGRVANAVRLDPGFRERAQDDPDLGPLRDSM